MRAFLCALLSAIALLVGGCNDEAKPDPTSPENNRPPVVQPSRPGLLYCYYGTWENQMAETAAHTNCAWAGPQWGTSDGITNVVNRLTEARAAGNRCVILDVLVAYSGEAALRAYLDTLDARGLIGDYICALYPTDEPDLQGYSAQRVAETNAMVRRVAQDYPFIGGIPLAAIYTSSRGYPGVETYDWVGVDDYDQREGVLGNTYTHLKARLRPEQRILLVPGGMQCDDVAPFYTRAQSDPQVIGVLPFIWWDGWNNGGGQGVRSLPCRPQYESAGTRITNP